MEIELGEGASLDLKSPSLFSSTWLSEKHTFYKMWV